MTISRLLGLLALLAGIVAILMVGLAGPGNRFGVWDWMFALATLFKLGAYVGMAAAGLGVLWVIVALIRKSREGMGRALTGIVLGALAVAPPLMLQARAGEVPPIHDITTNMDQPPAFVALAEARRASMNGLDYKPVMEVRGQTINVREYQLAAYPDIVTWRSGASTQAVFVRAKAAAEAQGWEIIAADETALRIEATATSMWFGFKDDVVIVIAQDGAGAKLDIRSASRVGLSDLGANADRIRAFIAELNKVN